MFHAAGKRIACMAVAIAACSSVMAQEPSVFAEGLTHPAKIILSPAGRLLVTEADVTPNTGRVSVIDSSGGRTTLVDGLPSGLSAPNSEPDGPTGMAIKGRTLYLAIGEGDSHINGATPGSLAPNPKMSSPIFATILKLDFSTDIDSINAGFSLKPQDQYTLADHAAVTATNSAGDSVTVNLLADFKLDRPDPVTGVRNTHLYALTMLPSQPNSLYVVDAGNNAVWQVDLTSGRSQILARFPNIPNATGVVPPASEAVPTSIHPYYDQLMVSLLSGAPFVPGNSRIVTVDPTTGAVSPLIGVLSSTIDTLFRFKNDQSSQWLVLEYSVPLGTGGPGRLRSYTSPLGQVLLDNLKTPSSMALDPATGKLYITDRTDGTVLVMSVGI